MRAIITGYKGYIGSKLYKKCQELGWEVLGIDLLDKEDVLEMLIYGKWSSFKPDIIFHMAALPAVQQSVEYPSYTLKHNVLGTSTVLEFAKKNNVKRVVFSSSSAIYGNNGFPVSPYGLHKLQSEMECRLYSELYNLDVVCLRYFNVYSPDQIPSNSYPTVISAWMKQIREGKDCYIFGDGAHSRDFIHVDDIISANLFVAEYEGKFFADCFDVGTGQSYSINYIKDYILSKKSIGFVNLESRKSDALSTIANTFPLNKLGWSAKIDFQTGLGQCF